MVFDELLPVLDNVRLDVIFVVVLMMGVAHFCLIALVATVATFGRGQRSDNAYRVLKILTRRKSRRPEARLTDKEKFFEGQ